MTTNSEFGTVATAFSPTVWSELIETLQRLDPKEGEGQIKYKFGYEYNSFSFHPAMNIPVMGRNKSVLMLKMLIKTSLTATKN